MIPNSKKLSNANKWVDQIFKDLPLLDKPYYVSKTALPLAKHPWLSKQLKKEKFILDVDACYLVRMTLMNPFLMTKETQTEFAIDFTKILNSISKSNYHKKKV